MAVLDTADSGLTGVRHVSSRFGREWLGYDTARHLPAESPFAQDILTLFTFTAPDFECELICRQEDCYCCHDTADLRHLKQRMALQYTLAGWAAEWQCQHVHTHFLCRLRQAPADWDAQPFEVGPEPDDLAAVVRFDFMDGEHVPYIRQRFWLHTNCVIMETSTDTSGPVLHTIEAVRTPAPTIGESADDACGQQSLFCRARGTGPDPVLR